ncbi:MULTISPECIES: hypothetical protein [Streptomyces]|uniref:hypothetical protein n=1 Tax=Streptomyces TaxID=1883 RepID=UPI0004CDAB9B|nr:MULTISPECIES: hypothetical protein [Streptomyces]RZE60392.1 hypothetical protein C0Q97_07925 [Streptomyces albidoflavus]WQG71159.1 hypothetical protein SR864_08320 [Streptomyces albidoflavus]
MDSGTGRPITYVPGQRSVRSTYTRRDEVPSENEVSLGLAGSVHERVNRIGQARDVFGRWQDKIRGRPPRPVRSLDEHAGEPLAQWISANVLYARKRAVPSFGFGLAPALTHTVAARRQRRLRFSLLLATPLYLVGTHPRGLLATVSVVLLWQFVMGRAVRSIMRWAVSALFPAVLFAAALFFLWSLVEPHRTLLHDAVVEGVLVTAYLSIATTAVHLLDRWVCHAYLQSVRPARRRVTKRPHLAPFAAKRIAAHETAERWQSIAYRKEDGLNRFVGAGLDSWLRGATRIQLTSARESGEADGPQLSDLGDLSAFQAGQKFEADELLDKVRDELQELRGALVETHALPNCDVAEFLGVPEGRWKSLRTSGGDTTDWPEAVEMCTEARDAPTGHFSRRYLAAQVVAWEGQIVVTVFAHAALEGNTLHFVTRPHVLAPLLPASNTAPAKGWDLARKLAETPLHAVGDTLALAAEAYRAVERGLGLVNAATIAASAVRQKDDGRPVSLREHCGQVTTDDMHQTEDVQRYVSILQSRMFSTVSAFLADHGLATGEFKRQAIEITQNFISGDNNQVNTGNMAGGMQQGNTPSGQGNTNQKAG